MPLSAAAHAALLYAASHIEWTARVEQRAAPPVMWLGEWPKRAVRPPEPPVVQEQVVAVPPPEEEAPPEPPDPAEPPAAAEPIAEPPAEPPIVAEESEPTPAVAPDAPGPPHTRDIDWEAARRRAAVSVIEDRARAGEYRSFSFEDLPEREPSGDTTPPTPIAEVMEDECVIVKNRFQRMAMMMIGLCVREARGDLFADAKPSYLSKRPECVDMRETQVAVVESASGREYPTIKCRMVDAEQ